MPVMTVDGVRVAVTRKPIRGLYLRVNPLTGAVEVSAPTAMADRRIVAFVRDRMDWIRRHQRRAKAGLDGGTGAAVGAAGGVAGTDGGGNAVGGTGAEGDRTGDAVGDGRDGITGFIRDAGTATVGGRPAGDAGRAADGAEPAVGVVWDDDRRRRARAAIETALPDLLERWSAIIGRSPTQVTLRLMTTRWGSCTPRTGRIRLNLVLGLMEPRFLEYVLVHEMTHLRAANHGPEFTRLMDGYLPQWRAIRAELNGGAGPR